jgi:hypothetical protein
MAVVLDSTDAFSVQLLTCSARSLWLSWSMLA